MRRGPRDVNGRVDGEGFHYPTLVHPQTSGTEHPALTGGKRTRTKNFRFHYKSIRPSTRGPSPTSRRVSRHHTSHLGPRTKWVGKRELFNIPHFLFLTLRF